MTRLSGLDLSRRFYVEAVRPILDAHFPRLEHAAALLGPGSEVLGYDDEVSTDHHWGPRVQIFVRDLDGAETVEETLARDLPTSFAGFPTNFGPADEIGVRLLEPIEQGPVAHRVELLTVRAFMRAELGFDPLEHIGVRDWLLTPSQRLLAVTAGEVFADPVGELTAVRKALAWYPHDVWLYAMAAQWRRIAALEHLLGRTGSIGDDLSSRLVAASLVRDLMRLALLQERRYAPYAKWLGTAYAALARREAPALAAALAADEWRERERELARAYRLVGSAHNALAVADHVDPEPRAFYGRQFVVAMADRFAFALRAAIRDPEVRALDHDAGAVDSVSDSTHVLTRPHLWRRLAPLYDRGTATEGERADGM